MCLYSVSPCSMMADPGMLHFTSLPTCHCFLGVPQTSMHQNYFSDRKFFHLFDIQVLKIPATNLEHSNVKTNLKCPYIWCCLGPSQGTRTCSVFFFCGFFFPAAFSLLGVVRTSIGLVSAACTQIPDSASLHLWCIENLAATRFKTLFSAWGQLEATRIWL